MIAANPIRAVLVSVGGSSAPLLFTLREHRPAHVWYFCSAGSRQVADAIHAQLDWHPSPRFIEVERFEELGPCYRELRRKLPEILAETHVSPREVRVDYTGGTKTMSAALVLAATELFHQFSYVGGHQREKGGLGVAVDGKERVFYQGNPWSDLAVREVERARDLWAGCQFEGAARVLREVAQRVPHRLRFEAVADLADAMAARHRLDFKEAVKKLGGVQKSMPALFDGHNDHGLIAFTSECLQVCVACSRDTASDEFLRELLDNILRTADQGRFEDAAARLYRALEMQGQLWLAESAKGLFVNGRCRREDVSNMPDSLKDLPFCQPGKSGEVKLNLEQLYLALNQLGDSRARKVVEDLAQDRKSRWRQATEKRNTSILAHGVSPIGRDGFETMKLLSAEFLGFDLTATARPIPSIDPRWFSSPSP